MPEPAEMALIATASGLLQRAGIPQVADSVTTISAGGNNRIYRIDTATVSYVAKHYFTHHGDGRDRLGAEFGFLRYAHQVAPNYVPQPLSMLQQDGFALYEYIDGSPITSGEVGEEEVDAANGFFAALNGCSVRGDAVGLPLASESAFSLNEHLQIVDRRLTGLQGITVQDEIDRDAADFVQRLDGFWKGCKKRILDEMALLGWDIQQPLSKAQRCISPSDFGFHNALRTADGQIKFVDFEYAGWDDPSKMVVDFFTQPAVPVPMRFYESFTSKALSQFDDSQSLLRRTLLLRPIHQIKWCCIALNIFLPVHMARRKFADSNTHEQALKLNQLKKAKELFKKTKEAEGALH